MIHKITFKKLYFFCLITCLTVTLSAGSKFQVKNAKSSDEVTISYIVEGSGSTSLFFVHGWNMNSSYWDNQIEYFRPNYKVIAIDLAGYGNSTKERGDYTIEAFAKDVIAVVDNENLQNIILVGHSMGSSVVIEAAAQLGDKVIGIIGVDSYQDLNEKYTKEQKTEGLRPLRDNFDEFCPVFVQSLFPSEADSVLVNKVAADMCSADYNIAISAIVNLFDYDVANHYAQLTAPIRAVNSNMYPSNIKGNRSVYKNFDVKIMDGVGHFPMLEKPEMFNNLLKETIEEIISK